MIPVNGYKKKECDLCDKIFAPRSPSSKTCDKCLTKKCKNCGKKFRVPKVRIESANYCGANCSEHAKKEFIPKHCALCGKIFKPSSSSNKVCTKCSTRKCAACGEPFKVNLYRKDTAKFCSRKCLGLGREYSKIRCGKCRKLFMPRGSNHRLCDSCCSFKCKICGTLKRVKPSKLRLDAIYCSKECRSKGDMNHIWSKRDERFVSNNYPHKLSASDIANKYETSTNAVYRLASKLGLDSCPIEIRSARSGKSRLVWTKKRIIEELNRLYEVEQANSSYVQKKYGSLFVAACKTFGNYKKAIVKAGLSYDEINLYSKRTTWKRSSILRTIRDMDNDGVCLEASFVRDNHADVFVAARREPTLGDWQTAIESAGLDYSKIRKSSFGHATRGKDKRLYVSKKEAEVANELIKLKRKGIISEYECQVKVSSTRWWTCDFVIHFDGKRKLWLEVDGLGQGRREEIGRAHV